MKLSCLRPLAALLLTLGLAACGGKASYEVGGTITGLTANGLTLSIGNNSTSPLAGSTTYTFATVDDGIKYGMVITTYPAGQTCKFVGSASADGRDVVGTMGSAATTGATLNCTAL